LSKKATLHKASDKNFIWSTTVQEIAGYATAAAQQQKQHSDQRYVLLEEAATLYLLAAELARREKRCVSCVSTDKTSKSGNI
jgi:hypothetical protein